MKQITITHVYFALIQIYITGKSLLEIAMVKKVQEENKI